MQESRQVTLRRVYAWLTAMSANVPTLVYEQDADRFNKLMDELAALGYQVGGFKIDKQRDMFDDRMQGRSYSTTGPNLRMTPDLYKTHIDAALAFLSLDRSDTNVTNLMDRRGDR